MRYSTRSPFGHDAEARMKLSDNASHNLRRLHSLSGVIPVGVFLLEHLFTNSFALFGAAAFQHAADRVRHLPFVVVLEVALIGVPILFHMLVGVLIIATASADTRMRQPRNALYIAQRVSGVFLAFFIIFHTWSTRLSPEGRLPDSDLFAIMHRQLADPLVFSLYVLGTIAACFHLGNGLFGFSIHWGLARDRATQRRVARFAIVTTVVLALVGVNALMAFTNHPWLKFGPDTTAMVVPAAAAR
jgi:succinate dehydrogenase / fumarate reductase cytochrome b subunit